MTIEFGNMEVIFHSFTHPVFNEKWLCASAVQDTEDTLLTEEVIDSVVVMLGLMVSACQIVSQVTTQNQETWPWGVGMQEERSPVKGIFELAFNMSRSREYKLINDGSNSSKTFPVILPPLSCSCFLLPTQSHQSRTTGKKKAWSRLSLRERMLTAKSRFGVSMSNLDKTI